MAENNTDHEAQVRGKVITSFVERRQAAIEKELLAPLLGEHLVGKEWTHENLVHATRSHIKDYQASHAEMSWIGKTYREGDFYPPEVPPEKAIRKMLDFHAGSGNKDKAELFFTLRCAWDALAYERYKPGSIEETLAGTTLAHYYDHYNRVVSSDQHITAIKLTPLQSQLLGALAEATDIPQRKGQTEIEIPEKLRHYGDYARSEEYLERLWSAERTHFKERGVEHERSVEQEIERRLAHVLAGEERPYSHEVFDKAYIRLVSMVDISPGENWNYRQLNRQDKDDLWMVLRGFHTVAYGHLGEGHKAGLQDEFYEIAARVGLYREYPIEESFTENYRTYNDRFELTYRQAQIVQKLMRSFGEAYDPGGEEDTPEHVAKRVFYYDDYLGRPIPPDNPELKLSTKPEHHREIAAYVRSKKK